MTQAEPNLVMDLEDVGCRARLLIQTFCNQHRPHQGIANARPLKPLPSPITEPDQIAHLSLRRRQRMGGILTEYEHAA
ncbi:hypothetical protein [Actinomadura napierensis]|uniref:hypothetical protein n=1 Tax=Actinomadura napierensis TaxID=267854 RepID=UPI0031CF7A07